MADEKPNVIECSLGFLFSFRAFLCLMALLNRPHYKAIVCPKDMIRIYIQSPLTSAHRRWKKEPRRNVDLRFHEAETHAAFHPETNYSG